jgi:hypothetical protein
MKIIRHGPPVVISRITNVPCGMCPSGILPAHSPVGKGNVCSKDFLAMEKEVAFLLAAFRTLYQEQYLYSAASGTCGSVLFCH